MKPVNARPTAPASAARIRAMARAIDHAPTDDDVWQLVGSALAGLTDEDWERLRDVAAFGGAAIGGAAIGGAAIGPSRPAAGVGGGEGGSAP